MYYDGRWECLFFVIVKVTHNCEYSTVEIVHAKTLYFVFYLIDLFKNIYTLIYNESTIFNSPSKKKRKIPFEITSGYQTSNSNVKIWNG